MSALPEKPAAVAHVSDAHWEAALRRVWKEHRDVNGRLIEFEAVSWKSAVHTRLVADHARCLILLGEVSEPVDPIEAAMSAAYKEWNVENDCNNWKADFKSACRKHFAGLTFPVQP